jgi:type I restriction enzyme S subunit
MNLAAGRIDLADLRYSSSTQARSLCLRPGDVLFNRTNSLAQVGKTSLWRGELPVASFASYCVRFVCRESEIEPAYLVWYMNLQDVQIYIKRIATPAVQQVNVNPTRLRQLLEVRFPKSLDEQRNIVAVLEDADLAIRNTESVIAKQLQLKAGMLQDLLTRGLDAHGRLRITRYPDRAFKEFSLGELFTPSRDPGRSGLPLMSVTLRDGLMPRDPNERRVETGLSAQQHLLARRGDIAYNMMRMWQGACGLATEDCLLSPAYVVVSPNDRIDSAFAYLLFKSPGTIQKFHAYSRGLTDDRLRLYYHDFAKIKVTVPASVDEQRQAALLFAEFLERSKTDEQILAKLRLQKLGLMHDLLTGSVRV